MTFSEINVSLLAIQRFLNGSNDLVCIINYISLKEVRGEGGSFATFAYSMIPELSCHLRQMVRKDKSSLFGHISRNLKKKRRRYRHYRLKSPFAAKKKFCRQYFLQFLATLDILTNLFFF